MTDKTTTQNLTRTTATDDPKQVAAYLKALATEADQRMRAQWYDLGRSQRRPLAVVRKTQPLTLDINVTNPRVSYDRVDVDTAGQVDLAKVDYGILLTETGFWVAGGYLQCSGFGAADADIWLNLSGVEASNVTRDGGTAGTGIIGVSAHGYEQITVPNTTYVSMTFTWSGSSVTSTTTIQAAHLWAYKVRDL